MSRYVIELWIDGYENESDRTEAERAFILKQLSMTASSIRIVDEPADPEMLEIVQAVAGFSCSCIYPGRDEHWPQCWVGKARKILEKLKENMICDDLELSAMEKSCDDRMRDEDHEEIRMLRAENERLRAVMSAAASMAGKEWLTCQLAISEALERGGINLEWMLREYEKNKKDLESERSC